MFLYGMFCGGLVMLCVVALSVHMQERRLAEIADAVCKDGESVASHNATVIEGENGLLWFDNDKIEVVKGE